MQPNQQINKLYLNHKKWIQFAKTFLSAGNKFEAEDIVQEAYLKILNDLNKNKNKIISNSYMYNVIKSIAFDDSKRKTDPLKFAIKFPNGLADKKDVSYNDNLDNISNKVSNFVETFYWFDKLLFNLYRYEIRSIRKISKVTTIGHVQVFRTIKRCKQKIKSKFKNDYFKK